MDRQPRVFAVSSRQIMLIAASMIAIAMIVAPLAVSASTGSFVNIRDPFITAASGQARVVNNHLITSACNVATGSINGTNCAYISGGRMAVDARSTSGNLSSLVVLNSSSSTTIFGPYAAGAKFNISSMTFSNTGSANPLQVRVRLLHPASTDCTAGGTVESEVTWVAVPANETVHLTYPAPLLATAAPSEGTLCLVASLPTLPAGAEVRLQTNGYLG